MNKLFVKLGLVNSLKIFLWTPILVHFGVMSGVIFWAAGRSISLPLSILIAWFATGNFVAADGLIDQKKYDEAHWDDEEINRIKSKIGLKPASEGGSE